jgi:hypothetical protein
MTIIIVAFIVIILNIISILLVYYYYYYYYYFIIIISIYWSMAVGLTLVGGTIPCCKFLSRACISSSVFALSIAALTASVLLLISDTCLTGASILGAAVDVVPSAGPDVDARL